jgi:tetratricopeptide (TPR) repeat protein
VNDRATILDDKGDYERAIAEYDKILASQPDNGGALNGRAWAYAHQGQRGAAVSGDRGGAKDLRFSARHPPKAGETAINRTPDRARQRRFAPRGSMVKSLKFIYLSAANGEGLLTARDRA